MRKLKLYVWDKWSPNYTDGMAFAIAESVEEAQSLIREQGDTCTWGPVQEFELESGIAFICYGGG